VRRLFFAIAVFMLSALVVPAAAHAGPSGVVIPSSGFAAAVVDDAHQHIFVSSGSTTDPSILVINFDGSVAATIPNESGATEMTLDATSGTVYVTLHGVDAISAISTSTLAETNRFSVGPSAGCPGSLAFAARKIWFSYTCGSGGTANRGIASLDPTTGTLQKFEGGAYPPVALTFIADPGNPKYLFAADHFSAPTIYEFNVGGAAPVIVKYVEGPGGELINAMAATPDGKQLFVSGRLNEVDSYSTNTLTLKASYPTTQPAWAVAVSHDGAFVAAGQSPADTVTSYVYPVGSNTSVETYTLATPDLPTLFPGGLAFSSDSSWLFAFTGSGSTVVFSAVKDPTLLPSTLSLTADPSSIPPGSSTSLTGSLALGGLGAAGQTVHVLETPPGGSQSEIATETTDGTGGYGYTTAPLTEPGTYAFETTWESDGTYRSALATADVQVGGGKIVFDSDRSGNYDVYAMNPDGSGVTDLTNNAADDASAAWSPDGTKVAFSSGRSGNFDIWVMNADGTGLDQLTHKSAFDAFPAWSPDGTKIAFESTRSGNYDVYSMNADGTGVVQLTKKPQTDELPTWSPDGSLIAFDSNRGGSYDLYTIHADGSHVVQITKNAAADFEPRWSPDGATFAFVSTRSAGYQIWTIGTNAKGAAQVTADPSDNLDPTWSPDGTQLAFDSDRTGTFQIYTIAPDGSGTTEITSAGDVNELPNWVGDASAAAPLGAPARARTRRTGPAWTGAVVEASSRVERT
jgi:TolB protein